MMTREQLIEKIQTEGTDNVLDVDGIKLRLFKDSDGDQAIEAKINISGKTFEFNLWNHYKAVDKFSCINFHLENAASVFEAAKILSQYLGASFKGDSQNNAISISAITAENEQYRSKINELSGKISVYERITPVRQVTFNQ